MTSSAGQVGFPRGFFDRDDPSPDRRFYFPPRLVTHIDDAAITAVGELYAELGVDGSAPGPRRVLDLMSSWVSHLQTPPAELVVLGMNAAELAANPMATERVVADLNTRPVLPFADATFDAVLCCVSIDYLIHPVEVLAEAARVLRPGAPVVLTFSNRCFPTKVRPRLARHGRSGALRDRRRLPASGRVRSRRRRSRCGRRRGATTEAATAGIRCTPRSRAGSGLSGILARRDRWTDSRAAPRRRRPRHRWVRPLRASAGRYRPNARPARGYTGTGSCRRRDSPPSS